MHRINLNSGRRLYISMLDVNDTKRIATVELINCERDFKVGYLGAILDAISECAINGWVMPDWLADAFEHAHGAVRGGEKRSWDDVFGKPHKKGAHLKSPQDWALSFRVCRAVMIQGREQPIDDELFSAVGKQFGMGATKVKKYYAERKDHLSWLSEPRSPKSPSGPQPLPWPRKSTSRKSKKRDVT
jgi:hypothetical protein